MAFVLVPVLLLRLVQPMLVVLLLLAVASGGGGGGCRWGGVEVGARRGTRIPSSRVPEPQILSVTKLTGDASLPTFFPEVWWLHLAQGIYRKQREERRVQKAYLLPYCQTSCCYRGILDSTSYSSPRV